MRKAGRKAKMRYDHKVRGAVPEIGDLVLVKRVGLTGRQKIADRWESEPYEIVGKPDPDMPVYSVRKCHADGPVRTLHRNMLFPLSLPLPEEEGSDEHSNGSVDDVVDDVTAVKPCVDDSDS